MARAGKKEPALHSHGRKAGSENQSSGRGVKPAQRVSLATGAKSVGAVRIIGGRFKRTPLAVQDREGLRPTPDRVRETVFDWLMHLSGGTIEDLTVLDMFAGSGAMGLEAASRGARRVVCTELNRKSAAQIRAVVEKLGATGTVNVVCGDVFSYVGSTNETFDIVFIDPPFAESLQAEALSAVKPRLTDKAVVYVESDREISEEKLQDQGFASVRRGRAGAVFYLLAQQNFR
ncbi:16S rRNA (guanine(966)-N(2))-methyltransferase RsmD [Duodenibacillus massiliensis]|uniref:16S rRNA (guanine(966)-N(2))-methyltransferase RsmD n=1 Tax=Duodenibacillus massiliensis TaxID=1852381 RepID=UPI00093F53E2|nr:16S rRNA (guanine(966)-N(2))-methyltransferase RsmD [Duodenibacillus massiliensis]